MYIYIYIYVYASIHTYIHTYIRPLRADELLPQEAHLLLAALREALKPPAELLTYKQCFPNY